jgi:hypothetical protein
MSGEVPYFAFYVLCIVVEKCIPLKLSHFIVRNHWKECPWFLVAVHCEIIEPWCLKISVSLLYL